MRWRWGVNEVRAAGESEAIFNQQAMAFCAETALPSGLAHERNSNEKRCGWVGLAFGFG